VSFTKKVVTTYSKALFQNVNNVKTTSSKTNFDVSKITSNSSKTVVPNVYIIGEELMLLSSALVSSKKIGQFFNNPTYAEKQKLTVLLTIFPGLSVTMKSFLEVLTERSHLALLPEICEEYTKLLLKFKNSTKVKLITASSLEERYGSLLLTKLQKLTGSSEVILNIAYNPKLLGGFIVEYNSTSIDASVLKEFSLFFTDL
jgi:ATP synthase F1 delta subunit